MSFMSELTETDAANIKIPHISVLSSAKLTAADNSARILWLARCAYLY